MGTSKEAYQAKLEAQLREWGARIDELKAKAKKAKADAKIEYLEQIEKLHAQQSAAQAMLQEFQQSGEQTWKELKPRLDRAWKDLKNAVDHARSRFG